MVIKAIPPSLQHAIAAAIGLFIAFIGLQQGGVIVGNPGSLVQLGDITRPPVLLMFVGLIVTAVLLIRKVPGAILWGMIATALIGLPFGLVTFHGFVSAPPSLAPTFLRMDIAGAWNMGLATVIIVFLFMVLFDTVGTVIGVSSQAGYLKNGKLPRAGRVLMTDAIGTTIGAALGTSTVTSYIESCAGIAAGARTGLANMLTGFLFLLALFFVPLVQMVGGGYAAAGGTIVYPITAPVLVLVGAMMAKSMMKINWDDWSDAIPAFLTMIGMPLTYNIAHGLAFGIITYPLLKLLSGKGKEVSWLMYVLALLFILRYALMKS
jgi:AGZA family xanthine/uracil permease-like MFS transporter